MKNLGYTQNIYNIFSVTWTLDGTSAVIVSLDCQINSKRIGFKASLFYSLSVYVRMYACVCMCVFVCVPSMCMCLRRAEKGIIGVTGSCNLLRVGSGNRMNSGLL